MAKPRAYPSLAEYSPEQVMRMKSMPVTVNLMTSVVGDVLKTLRTQLQDDILRATNDLRSDLNMPAAKSLPPSPKPRVKVAAGTGERWR